jgi:hypothetical protein
MGAGIGFTPDQLMLADEKRMTSFGIFVTNFGVGVASPKNRSVAATVRAKSSAAGSK